MSRLFVTDREFSFFSDIVKETMKDISGQSVYYYPVNRDLTNPDDVYNESLEKIFDRPLYIPAVIEYQGQSKVSMTDIILSKTHTIIAHLHRRDLDDKGIVPREGDFIQFGEINYEIKTVLNTDIQYGQIEHKYWYSVSCEQTDTKVFYKEEQPILNLKQGEIPDYFTQVRGDMEKDFDIRDLREKIGEPLTGAKKSPFELFEDE